MRNTGLSCKDCISGAAPRKSPVGAMTWSSEKTQLTDKSGLFFRTVYRALGIDASFTFIFSQRCAQNHNREKVDNQQTRL